MISDRDLNGKRKSHTGANLGAGAIAVAILAGIMGFTNPPRQEYLSYASDKLASELKGSVCKESEMREFLGQVGGSLAGACKSLVTSQRQTIEKFIDNSTQRQNLIVLSIYTSEVGKHTYRTVGAFGNFLTFSDK